MFWGLTILGGNRYTQKVDRSFHVSMAALECDPSAKEKPHYVQVKFQQQSDPFLLCTLGPGVHMQQPLDLIFNHGESVTFFLEGKGVVHLTGYLVDDFDDEEDALAADYLEEADDSESDAPQLKAIGDDSSDEEDEDWLPESHEVQGSKRKVSQINGRKHKRIKITELEDKDDEEEDEDGVYDSSFIDDEALEEEDEDSDEDEEFEESLQTPSNKTESSPEMSSASKKKKKEKSLNTKENKVNQGQVKEGVSPAGDVAGGETAVKKKKKKKKKKNKQDENPTAEQPTKTEPAQPTSPKPSPVVGKKRKVAGGTGVEDTKIGHGPEAKPGNMVSVYYSGTLAKNNKRFDSCLKGKPFRFRLGRGEVIRGWDNGVIGMRVGGKRRIVVPPTEGYGNARQGPIPPGSTLIFEVEMKAVS